MEIICNGKPQRLSEGSTLQNLLDEMKLDSQRVVVERNRQIVPRQRLAETALVDGDVLELIHFVGGG
jgi:thiamine biosynthesis protein ThiS